MNDNIEIGRVWQINLNAEEEDYLCSILIRNDLPDTPEGLKMLLLKNMNSNDNLKLSPEMEVIITKGLEMAGNFIKKKVGL